MIDDHGEMKVLIVSSLLKTILPALLKDFWSSPRFLPSKPAGMRSMKQLTAERCSVAEDP